MGVLVRVDAADGGYGSAGALVAASCRWENDAKAGAVERVSVKRARRREARGY